MFKRVKKMKRVEFRDYLIVANPREMKEIKTILNQSLVNNNRKLIRTHNRFEIYKNGRVAKIRFLHAGTDRTFLDGLRINLALTSKDCSNHVLNIVTQTTLCFDGESLYLCDQSIKQLVGDILTFTEGVGVNVEAGM